MAVDLVIRNALIIDGTGSDSYSGDVAVEGDRIVAVGDISGVELGEETTEIDAEGQVVAPGFIDVHTHDDGALLRHPGMEFKLAQGCTTVVIGNCGFSAAPAIEGQVEPSGLIGVEPSWSDFDGFCTAVDEANPAVNAMGLVGHNTIRSLVLGEDVDRPPTEVEMEEMKRHVREAMEGGACGFSTGLVYQPGRWSDTEEVAELASVAAGFDGIYATHIRNEADHLLEAVDEAIDIGRRAGMPVQMSHHKSAGRRNWGRVKDSLAKVDTANIAGDDVTLDVYPYTAGSGPMAQYFDLDDLDLELAETVRFASCPAFRDYEGKMAVDLAEERGVPATAIIDEVLRAPEGDQTVCIQFHMDEGDVETILGHDLAMVGSDGIPELDGTPHPRLFGTFPRVLGHYVRERGVVSLVEAVRRMTSLSSDRFGLTDRGRLVEGAFADLVVFDPESVIDTATYDHPKQEPTGISLVVVNGAVALQDQSHTGAGTGRMLRFQPS